MGSAPACLGDPHHERLVDDAGQGGYADILPQTQRHGHELGLEGDVADGPLALGLPGHTHRVAWVWVQVKARCTKCPVPCATTHPSYTSPAIMAVHEWRCVYGMGCAGVVGVGTKCENILENVLDRSMECGYSMGMTQTQNISREQVGHEMGVLAAASMSGPVSARQVRDAIRSLHRLGLLPRTGMSAAEAWEEAHRKLARFTPPLFDNPTPAQA